MPGERTEAPAMEQEPGEEPEELLAIAEREKLAQELKTPQPQPPVLQASPARIGSVPCSILLDTLPVCLDFPPLDLEPRESTPSATVPHQDVAVLLPDIAGAPPVHCFTPPG